MAVSKEGRESRLDAERAVIGSLLIDPELTRPILASVRDGDFLNPVNRMIFQAARALFRAGIPVDAITLRDRVGAEHSRYMAELIEITPTAANWEAYADAMRQQATLSRLSEYAAALQDAVTLDDCRPICAKIDRELHDGTTVDAWDMRQMINDFCSAQDPDAPPPVYIDYGFSFLRGVTYTQPGDVVMIGGYPSDGKTALSLQMADAMARTNRVGYFSLETDKSKIRDRLVSFGAQVEFDRIKTRRLTEEDWQSFALWSQIAAKQKFTVIQAAGMTASMIQSVSQAYAFDVIFIDYIQLVVPEIDPRAPRSEQMASVSRQLHTFAQKSGTLVVELAQLTRAEKGGWRPPVMSDLKESGQFEQDADMIFMVSRPNPNPAQDEPKLDQETTRVLSIVKNKEGRRGRWPLAFDGAKQTFALLADADEPPQTRQEIYWGDGSYWRPQPTTEGKQT